MTRLKSLTISNNEATKTWRLDKLDGPYSLTHLDVDLNGDNGVLLHEKFPNLILQDSFDFED